MFYVGDNEHFDCSINSYHIYSEFDFKITKSYRLNLVVVTARWGENEVVRCGLTPNLSLDLKHEGFSRSMEYPLKILSPYRKPLLLGFALNFLVNRHIETHAHFIVSV